MEFVGFGLALAGFLLAAMVWWWSNKRQDEAAAAEEELEAKLAAEAARAEKAESDRDTAQYRITKLEKELAEAVSRRDEKAMASALWDLELERSYRQWRDVILPQSSGRTAESVSEGQKLAFAIGQEVDRLREEVGVAIRFDGGLDFPLEPETALGTLRITEELLALAAKRSDELVVRLDQGAAPSLTVSLECLGWLAEPNGDEEVGDSLDRMTTKLDGSMTWSEAEGDVSCQLTVPLPATLVPGGPEADGESETPMVAHEPDRT